MAADLHDWLLVPRRPHFRGYSSLHWFERGRDNLLAVEEFLARVQIGDQGALDAPAPPAAGGAL